MHNECISYCLNRVWLECRFTIWCWIWLGEGWGEMLQGERGENGVAVYICTLSTFYENACVGVVYARLLGLWWFFFCIEWQRLMEWLCDSLRFVFNLIYWVVCAPRQLFCSIWSLSYLSRFCCCCFWWWWCVFFDAVLVLWLALVECCLFCKLRTACILGARFTSGFFVVSVRRRLTDRSRIRWSSPCRWFRSAWHSHCRCASHDDGRCWWSPCSARCRSNLRHRHLSGDHSELLEVQRLPSFRCPVWSGWWEWTYKYD